MSDKTLHTQQGMALVTALLYLLVMTCLVAGAFSSGLLQTKISQHLLQETKAFEKAESALRVGESAIVPDEQSGEGGSSQDATYRFVQITRPECGLYYQVDSFGTDSQAKTHLESFFVFPQAGLNPCIDFSSPHRVVWRELGS